MELKYYVLGKKDNKLLINSLNKYYTLLLTYLDNLEFTNKNLLLDNSNNIDFILSPDISSIIEVLYNLKNNNLYDFLDINILKKLFESELEKFISWYFEKLISNKWTIIWNTNIRLTTFDFNPLNVLDEHPDHTENDVVWWGSIEESKWLEVYTNVFDILKKTDIWIYEELNFIIKKIVPLGTAKNVHNSASYAECIWHLYMWYTLESDILEALVLEAIIHESSHNKLNLIHKFDNILNNDYELKYYSPYRPDARHMWWVFLWVHALTPTVFILLNAYNKWFLKSEDLLKKVLIYNKKNILWLRVIEKYWDLTKVWVEILDELKYVIKLTNTIISTMNIDNWLSKSANEENKKHILNVIKNYSYLKY